MSKEQITKAIFKAWAQGHSLNIDIDSVMFLPIDVSPIKQVETSVSWSDVGDPVQDIKDLMARCQITDDKGERREPDEQR